MLDILKFVWLRLELFDNSGVENEQLKVGKIILTVRTNIL
jgi:hypothetical protein